MSLEKLEEPIFFLILTPPANLLFLFFYQIFELDIFPLLNSSPRGNFLYYHIQLHLHKLSCYWQFFLAFLEIILFFLALFLDSHRLFFSSNSELFTSLTNILLRILITHNWAMSFWVLSLFFLTNSSNFFKS